MAGASVATDLQMNRLDIDTVRTAVKTALMSDEPLRLASGIEVSVPKLASEEAANDCTAEIVNALQ